MPDGGPPVLGEQFGHVDLEPSVVGRPRLALGLVLLLSMGAWLSVDLSRSLQRPLRRAASPIEGERFDPRMASVADWTLIPGVGPALARRLHEARPHGGACSLVEIPGIGPVTARRAAPHLQVARPFDFAPPIVDDGASFAPERTKGGSS
ncbi:MAG: hypothetical protein CMJ23_06730 [Phycisphaerae bacterium]|nr:hypothetical protein [Phycisphaerae bacterium]